MRKLFLALINLAVITISCVAAQATPYIVLDFSGEIIQADDPAGVYSFAEGSYAGKIVFHGEGLLNQQDSIYHSYYLFERGWVDFLINGVEVVPLYEHYSLVHADYLKPESLWGFVTGITVDQANYRYGPVNQDYLNFSEVPGSEFFTIYDQTQLLGYNNVTLDTRYHYTGTITGMTTQIFDLVGGEPEPVPEPATMLLMGVGIAGLFGARARREKIEI